jgi:hypothetical protein
MENTNHAISRRLAMKREPTRDASDKMREDYLLNLAYVEIEEMKVWSAYRTNLADMQGQGAQLLLVSA